MSKSRLIPILIFIALIAGLSWRVTRPSGTAVFAQIVSRPMPPIDLDPVRAGEPRFTSAAFTTGKPQLLNLFGSWCIPCIAEAAQLMTLKREGVTIRGIAVRDRSESVAAFLSEHGDPFTAIGLDPDSKAQLLLGSQGVPETFVVDGNGTIVRRFIGGLDEDSLTEVRAALAEATAVPSSFQSHEEERHALFGTFTGAERWLVLADSYARTGDRAGATEAIRAGLRARPEDAELWAGLGTALVDETGQLSPDAQAALAKALKLAPDSPGPRYFLGAAMLRSGDRAGALTEWKKLLATAPKMASWRPMVERKVAGLKQ